MLELGFARNSYQLHGGQGLVSCVSSSPPVDFISLDLIVPLTLVARVVCIVCVALLTQVALVTRTDCCIFILDQPLLA